MFDSPSILMFVPSASLTALRSCAVPVLRRHHHDDVLPDLPEGTELLPQYTLHRPADAWSEEAAGWTADAADGFLGQEQHTGLVITASQCSRQPHAGVLAINSSSNRFPWHAKCQRIAARGCSVGAAQLREAATRGKAGCAQRQQHPQHCTPLQWWPSQLVAVALPDEQPLLHDLAAAIHTHNTAVMKQHEALQQAAAADAAQPHAHQQQQQQQQLPLIVPLLAQTVQHTAAAVAVQAAWRSHSSRLQQDVANRLLFNRAAAAIQRAWHAYLLRGRLAMLAAAAEAHRHAQTQLRFSCIMCLDVAGVQLMEAAAERCRQSSALFPEHRLWFAIEPEGGDLFLIDAGSSSSSSSSEDGEGDAESSSDADAGTSASREGLPAWVGADIPVIPAECAAAADAVSRAHVAKLLELCCSVKDLLDPAKIRAGAYSRRDVAQLVTFRSKQQAAQRAALLAAFTYDLRSGQYAKLMTVQESPLGAAYRNLTGLSTTASSSTSNATCAAAAPGGSARTASHLAQTVTAASSSTAAAGRPQQRPTAAACATAGQGARHVSPREGCLHQGTQSSYTQSASQPAALCSQEPAQQLHPSPAAALQPAASCCSATSSPRMLGYAVPLQAIHPTSTLAAAAAATPGPAASGTAGAASAAAGCGSSILQLYVSVLTRFPYLVKELVAEELLEQDLITLEAVEAWAQSKVQSSVRAAVGAAAGVSSPLGGTLDSSSSGSGSEEGPAGGQCCVVSQPPSTLRGEPAVNSLGAYLERTKLQQVGAFKCQLASTSAAAAEAAAADGCARQAAVAAARAGEAEQDGMASVLLNTSNISGPHYWPDTTASATAAAQAFRQQAEALAAARCAALRELQQQAAAEAAAREQQRREAASAAAKADAEATRWRLRQEQHQQQAAAQHRAGALRHLRTAAPGSRRQQQQQVAAFATECNRLSKFLRNDIVQRTKAVERAAAAQRVQQQRCEQEQAAAALEALKHEKLCAAQDSVLAVKLQAAADLAAVRAIQELEEAARRAGAAARRHHERSHAVESVGAGGQ